LKEVKDLYEKSSNIEETDFKRLKKQKEEGRKNDGSGESKLGTYRIVQ
jgi:hypothetical protein